MIVTAPDLVSALFFLLLLEGFRRVGPEDIVLALWRSRWSIGKNPRTIWFKSIGWLWSIPLQFQPSAFLCRTGHAGWLTGDGLTPDEVRRTIDDISHRYRILCVLTTLQASVVLLVLPLVGVFGSTRAIYAGILVVICLAVAVTVCAWPHLGWSALKYTGYPPSSVFAVVDGTIGALEKVDFDAVLVATLPVDQSLSLLRRYYRRFLYASDSSLVDRDKVTARILAITQGRSDAEAILPPPERSTDQILTYCPCCDGEYVIPAGDCSDCAGVRLVSFAQAVRS